MEENSFTMKDENGKEIKYDVLFTFQMEETNKDYIVYTDNTTDKEGNIQVYASVYRNEEGKMNLEAIETDNEWKTIETILKTIQEKDKNKRGKYGKKKDKKESKKNNYIINCNRYFSNINKYNILLSGNANG